MLNLLQNNKVPISLGRVELFVYLLLVVTHQWKLQCYHALLVGYGPACPKFYEITNHQYLWKGLSDFLDFFACSYFHLVRYSLKLQNYAILGWPCHA